MFRTLGPRFGHFRRAFYGIVVLAVALLAESSSAFPTSTNSPPIVSTFGISSPHSGSVTVSGFVNDEYPSGCYIQFGGALAGQYALVNEDGSFGINVSVGYYDAGPVSALAVDDFDQYSDLVWDVIL